MNGDEMDDDEENDDKSLDDDDLQNEVSFHHEVKNLIGYLPDLPAGCRRLQEEKCFERENHYTVGVEQGREESKGTKDNQQTM